MTFTIRYAKSSHGAGILATVLIDNDLIDNISDKSEINALAHYIHENQSANYPQPILIEPVYA